ncbi:MAG: hypothetical protein JWM11_3020 [Planctomycetaceae bacterium]|nr:hypothetical protein [Planctomycetaceae bacterium]
MSTEHTDKEKIDACLDHVSVIYGLLTTQANIHGQTAEMISEQQSQIAAYSGIANKHSAQADKVVELVSTMMGQVEAMSAGLADLVKEVRKIQDRVHELEDSEGESWKRGVGPDDDNEDLCQTDDLDCGN